MIEEQLICDMNLIARGERSLGLLREYLVETENAWHSRL